MKINGNLIVSCIERENYTKILLYNYHNKTLNDNSTSRRCHRKPWIHFMENHAIAIAFKTKTATLQYP